MTFERRVRPHLEGGEQMPPLRGNARHMDNGTEIKLLARVLAQAYMTPGYAVLAADKPVEAGSKFIDPAWRCLAASAQDNPAFKPIITELITIIGDGARLWADLLAEFTFIPSDLASAFDVVTEKVRGEGVAFSPATPSARNLLFSLLLYRCRDAEGGRISESLTFGDINEEAKKMIGELGVPDGKTAARFSIVDIFEAILDDRLKLECSLLGTRQFQRDEQLELASVKLAELFKNGRLDRGFLALMKSKSAHDVMHSDWKALMTELPALEAELLRLYNAFVKGMVASCNNSFDIAAVSNAIGSMQLAGRGRERDKAGDLLEIILFSRCAGEDWKVLPSANYQTEASRMFEELRSVQEADSGLTMNNIFKALLDGTLNLESAPAEAVKQATYVVEGVTNAGAGVVIDYDGQKAKQIIGLMPTGEENRDAEPVRYLVPPGHPRMFEAGEKLTDPDLRGLIKVD
ncbi:Uncharacterised protein [Candidatus Burarchaeum australiense]|nr:Uncharacterised protein [Candidatus Burarchaeum australiense]